MTHCYVNLFCRWCYTGECIADLNICSLLLLHVGFRPGVTRSALEGRCPAEFSCNPNQTHPKQLIKVLLGILETSRQVC